MAPNAGKDGQLSFLIKIIQTTLRFDNWAHFQVSIYVAMSYITISWRERRQRQEAYLLYVRHLDSVPKNQGFLSQSSQVYEGHIGLFKQMFSPEQTHLAHDYCRIFLLLPMINQKLVIECQNVYNTNKCYREDNLRLT